MIILIIFLFFFTLRYWIIDIFDYLSLLWSKCNHNVNKNKQATLSYSNLFNVSSSSHSTESFLVFGNGVQANIFNCVFQHFSQKKIITFYDHNHQETIIFNSCTFESNTPISFPSCTTYNLKFISNPTFIITSIPRKCDYPISQCNEKYSMHSLLTLFCSILISI